MKMHWPSSACCASSQSRKNVWSRTKPLDKVGEHGRRTHRCKQKPRLSQRTATLDTAMPPIQTDAQVAFGDLMGEDYDSIIEVIPGATACSLRVKHEPIRVNTYVYAGYMCKPLCGVKTFAGETPTRRFFVALAVLVPPTARDLYLSCVH